MTYLFLDVETTGLDTKEDQILEIAWAFTNNEFDMVGTPKALVIEQEDWHQTWSRIKSNKFVMDMHEKSGLIDDLTDDNFKRHTLDRAWAMLTSESRQMRGGRGEFVHLAGLSIHFDKAFLDANDFHGLWGDEDDISPIHHRMLDLSSFKLMMKSAGLDSDSLEVTNVNPHRAMADVAASIGFARNARNFLQTTGVTA